MSNPRRSFFYRRLPKRISSIAQSFHPPRFAWALRSAFAAGYGAPQLRADVLAGLTVGVIALPLSMALAIASGVPPQHGLYTAIIAGAASALFGGSRFQVSGPTAAFVVILAPISATFGLKGLLMATAMAGVILLTLGLLRLGRLIQFIPHPVTAGFTAGIGVVIATLQLPDLFGFQLPHNPEDYVERVALLFKHSAISPAAAAIGLSSLALLIAIPRFQRTIPAPLIVLPLSGVAAWLLQHNGVGGFETIADRFSYVIDGVSGRGIPQAPPSLEWPWRVADPEGMPSVALSWPTLKALLPAAFTIALLGAIESLLSAVIADAATQTEHDPDAELIGQGIGNLIAPFFGGIASTGALARTALNFRAGATSPNAAVVHALFVLLALLLLAPLLGYLPMPALAAMLLIVAWNMAGVRHVIGSLRTSPRSDVAVLLTCLGLTVIFDMVVAVTAGFMLASLLFMWRMVAVADVELSYGQHHNPCAPEGVLVYAIAGPLFFGAAQKAMANLSMLDGGIRVVIFDLCRVPSIDATGIVNLHSAIVRLESSEIRVVLAGLQPQPHRALQRAGLIGQPPHDLPLYVHVEEALAMLDAPRPIACQSPEGALTDPAADLAPTAPSP